MDVDKRVQKEAITDCDRLPRRRVRVQAFGRSHKNANRVAGSKLWTNQSEVGQGLSMHNTLEFIQTERRAAETVQ